MVRLFQDSSLNGVIQILVSLFWVWHFGELYYQYQNTDILFFFMFQNWTLILFILMGLLGALIGMSVYLKKITIKNGYFVLTGLLIVGLIINIAVMS